MTKNKSVKTKNKGVVKVDSLLTDSSFYLWIKFNFSFQSDYFKSKRIEKKKKFFQDNFLFIIFDKKIIIFKHYFYNGLKIIIDF